MNRDPVIESLNAHLHKEAMWEEAYDKALYELEDILEGYKDELVDELRDELGTDEMKQEVLKNLRIDFTL